MTGAPIDLETLKNIYGEDSTNELLELSLDEAEKLIGGLSAQVSARNSAGCAADAHQLKGMAATMTINAMSELARQLEHKAKNNEWEGTDDLLNQLSGCLLELRAFLGKSAGQ